MLDSLTIQDNNFVSGIHVEAVIKWESDGVVIKRCVGRGIVYFDWRMCETGHQFLNVPNPLHTGNGRTKRGVIPTSISGFNVACEAVKILTRSIYPSYYDVCKKATRVQRKTHIRIVKALPLFLGEEPTKR